MENFLLPSKIEFHPGANSLTGSLVVTPCFHGYGTTLGNAIRRVLLSSLSGGAVEAFKIKGVQHEFDTVDGVQEDVVEIMLNLKQLAVKVYSDEKVILKLSKKGAGPVTAGDIEKDSNVEIINKDLVIATLTANKTLEIDLVVGKGRGFRPVEDKDKQNYDLGTIVCDSIYTPVKDVGYKVEYTRVGDITNYEKLTVNIETNGTVDPQDACKQAVQILIDHFNIIVNNMVNVANEKDEVVEESIPVVVEEAITAEEMAEENEDEKPVKAKKKITKKK